MCAHVLLNLLNELRLRDKMQGLPSILSLFCSKFNKFNNTGARMLDPLYLQQGEHSCKILYIYLSYDIKITWQSNFWSKKVIILSLGTQCCYRLIT